MDSLNAIILNTTLPIVIKDVRLNWNCFEKNLATWCSEYNNATTIEHIDFEYAKRRHSDNPQWEKHRKKTAMTIKDFRNNSIDNENKFFEENWAALSYKNITELPKQCRKDVNFKCFGFPEIDEDDATFWLSSTGAHTPCHYDTYGCNIVVQVYGRKKWLLFPPSAKLSPVRVPYEESSVYSAECFYSPKSLQQFEKIKSQCYYCILEAGDILVVPRMWWHYVENLETSLSINHWIPLKDDLEAQLDECIVKFLIESFVHNDAEKLDILNPNQVSEVNSEQNVLNILQFLKNEATNRCSQENKKLKSKKLYNYQYLTEDKVQSLIDDSNLNIIFVEKISNENFLQQMLFNSVRFDNTLPDNNSKIKIDLINSICNPEIIKHIRDLFIKTN